MFKTARIFLAAPALVALTTLPAAADPIELRYATSQPSINSTFKRSILPFVERVAKDSGGTITIQTFPGNQLANAKTSISSLRDGTADAGFVIPIFVPSEIKTLNFMQQILFAGANAVAITGATAETVLLNCPGCRSELAAAGAMPMAPVATSAYFMSCTTDVPNSGSLKGRKMRIVGGAQKELLSDLGATRVVVPPPEVMEAMNRGQIDCAVSPLPWLTQFSLQEATKFIVTEPLGYARGNDMFTMSKAAWNKLAPDQKQAVFKNLPRLVADSVIAGYLFEQDEARKAAERKGIKFLKPDPEFVKVVAGIRAREKDIVVSDAKKRGVEGVDELWDSHVKTLAKWDKLSQEIGSDPAKMAQVLWDQVYSKLDPLTVQPKK